MPANTTPPPAKKKGRRARLIVIVLVLALVGGVGYGSYWGVSTVRASYPKTTGTLALPGLSGPVDVKRDNEGIPQIYADSNQDLFRAQGYVQAQDRFYQMDVQRHLTAGRLAEMFGQGQVKTDAFLRTLGLQRVAQQEYDTKLSADTKANLQAYADGVNAYLKGRSSKDISVEYAALHFSNDYKPQPWTPVDSVAWLKALAWEQSGNMQDEIDRSLLTTRLSEKQIDDLYPAYPAQNKPIVVQGAVNELTGEFDPNAKSGDESDSNGGSGTGDSENAGSGGGTGSDADLGAIAGTDAGADADSIADAAQSVDDQLDSLSGTLAEIPSLLGASGSDISSSAWVVSPALTTTGKPLLANAPDASAQIPSPWYQMGLHCRSLSKNCEYDTAGYSLPGMPGVVIGHNQNIAWGLTSLDADVTDLYLEKVDGDSYQFGNQRKKFVTRQETIKVAGGPSKKIIIRETNNGPLISDRSAELEKVGETAPVANSAPDRGDGYAIALKWTALQPGKTMDAIFELDRAANFKEFRTAASHFTDPAEGMVYADTEGHIGFQATGRIPVRAAGDDGSQPAPGWDPKFQWKSPIPFDALPYAKDPKNGYIVAANQAVVDPKTYPYTLSTDFDYGTRSQRISDLIASKTTDDGKISTDDMQSIQLDNSSEIARLLVPYLLHVDVSDPAVRQAQKLLEGWDYTQESDSGAAAYFNSVWRNLLVLAFGDKLPKELRVQGQCLNVRPADSADLPPDDLGKLVRECGERSPATAQPDGGDRWSEVVRDIIKSPDNSWWSTPASRRDPATRTRDQLLARAMSDARWELTAKLGKDTSDWSWGRLHQMTLTNPTLGRTGSAIVRTVLNRGPWNLGGGQSAVNSAGWNAAGGYQATVVPALRMVVNVGDWDKSRWINLTGASGHAYSAHYTDQTKKWARGELLSWSFGIDAVDHSTVDTLRLTP